MRHCGPSSESMNSRNTVWISIIGLLVLTSLVVQPALSGGPNENYSQTWPSRTPTSAGPPVPTSAVTPQPGSTLLPTIESPVINATPSDVVVTNVPPVQGNSTPQTVVAPRAESGAIQFPSAAEVGDCGLPPLVVALGEVAVRSGPGIEFDSIAKLIYQDTRPIIGRSANSPWWQIFFSVNQQGWVADQAVAVTGYTGAVPITDDREKSASQDEWSPTPNPRCTPPSEEDLILSDDQLAVLLTASTATPVSNNEQGIEQSTKVSNGNSQLTESAPQPENDVQPFSPIWLLIIGALLIVAGSLALLVQRRRS